MPKESGNRRQGRDAAPTFSFEAGQYFRQTGTVFRIVSIHASHFVLEHEETLDRRILPRSDMFAGYLEGSIIPCGPDALDSLGSRECFAEHDEIVRITAASTVSLLSEAAKQQGLRYLRYIRALEGAGHQSLRPGPLLNLDLERIARQLRDPQPPKASTLYTTWRAIQAAGGDLRAAFPDFHKRGGRGAMRTNNVVQQELHSMLTNLESEVGTDRSRIRITTIHSDLKGRLIAKLGEDNALDVLPSVSTIGRIVKQRLGAYEICVRNFGETRANKKFRSWTPRDRAVAPLEVVEFDDKDSGVFAIDERTFLPYGRAYVTAGVDQYTDVMLGRSISEKPRNTWSALSAIADCVLPKNLSDSEFSEVRSEVPFFGTMSLAVFDNARYNHSSDFEAGAVEITGAAIAYARPYTPTEKSSVERFNGRCQEDFFRNLPGYVGDERGIDDIKSGRRPATLTIQEFKRQFNKWCYDVYVNTPIKGHTPSQRWSAARRSCLQRVPTDIWRVRLATMHRARLRLRPEGIRFVGLIYQDPRLQLIRRRLGANSTIELRHHPDYLDVIFAQDPVENEWFRVPSASPEYTSGMTLYQHVLVRKMARESGRRNPVIPQLCQYREQLAADMKKACLSTKMRERKRARLAASAGEKTRQGAQQPTGIVSAVEDQVMRIDEVEMERGDEGWDLPLI